jgi:isovaleryl-CoA dehydrogenase
MFVSRRI